MLDYNATPSSPRDAQPTIGIIGMGAMGKLYARYFAQAGWQKIHVCDLPTKYPSLLTEYSSTPNIIPMEDGHAVSRSSDFIMYAVEAEFIGRVVREFGPSTKLNAIVSGQTSVKAPEKEAFEKYLPEDTYIISCHSLHGPSVNPAGQPLVIIRHRGPDKALKLVESILSCFKSRFVHLSYEEHDEVTANTQAVTHAAFLSMGTAWHSSLSYPWEQGLYVGGIETVKVNLTLRIYSNKWHVYAGLAILNPKAKEQIRQYAKSVTELYKLMLAGGGGNKEMEGRLRRRVRWGGEVVFGEGGSGRGDGDGDGVEGGVGGEGEGGKKRRRRPILLSQEILDKFSLGPVPTDPPSSTSSVTASTTSTQPSSKKYLPNSHLSLLAMVDSWAHLHINPYHHLSLAATPIFRLFLGVAEHLFLTEELLDKTLESALWDTWHRADDLEFVVASRGWSEVVSGQGGGHADSATATAPPHADASAANVDGSGEAKAKEAKGEGAKGGEGGSVDAKSFELYKERFGRTKDWFEAMGRMGEAGERGGEMIKAVMESELEREEEIDAS